MGQPQERPWTNAQAAEAMLGTGEPFDQVISAFRLLDAPGHLLRRAHQRSYELFTAHVGDEATRQQVALLLALAQRPGASQNELVADTGIDKSTLKEMLGRMVARGWVIRARDAKDSRAWTLGIAEAGRALLEQLLPRVAAAQVDILAPLTPEERPVFLACLRKVIGLGALPADEPGEASADP